MIRDFNIDEKIKFSKKSIDTSSLSFFWFWCFNVENIFDDLDFYMKENVPRITLRAKIAGIICGMIIIPLLLITYAVSFCFTFFLNKSKFTNGFARAIIFVLFLLPVLIIKFPFSLYTFIILKKNALIYLLKVDNDS